MNVEITITLTKGKLIAEEHATQHTMCDTETCLISQECGYGVRVYQQSLWDRVIVPSFTKTTKVVEYQGYSMPQRSKEYKNCRI